MTKQPLIVGVPGNTLRKATGDIDGVEYVVWDFTSPAPVSHFDIVVTSDPDGPEILTRLEGVTARLVQGQWIGYEGVTDYLPTGLTYANAAGVHEGATAELTLALILAMQRGITDFVRASEQHEWRRKRYPSLADRRVLLIGYGGVGKAIEEKLLPFEVELTRVARTSRVEEGPTGRPVQVHGFADLHALVPHAEIVILAVPLNDETYHLVDREFLSHMPDDALLVNVARGGVVDTDALVPEVVSGRLRFATDVTDPEPLPSEHPLWGLPNVLISPHLGGSSTAMLPRMAKLLRTQIERMLAGEPPLNVVIEGNGSSETKR